jgi:5-methylcytosine-specific restriction endonuclease McrA
MTGLYATQPEEQRFDESKYKLGKICSKGHNWNGANQSLRRINDNKCVQCCKDRGKARYYSNLEANRAAARERMNAKLQDPEYRKISNERTRLGNAKRRKAKGRNTRAKGIEDLVMPHGRGLSVNEARAVRHLANDGHPLEWSHLEPLVGPLVEAQEALERLISKAGRCPSVAQLVEETQQRYWRENPEILAEHRRERTRIRWRIRYQTSLELRLYNREKAKRRKAAARGQTPVQIPVNAIRRRFNEFGNCCAYCGTGGEMEMEHIVPISKGGPHDIANIVPACTACNASKRSRPMERWYRAQPFFSELRLQQIRQVMRGPEYQQLALA